MTLIRSKAPLRLGLAGGGTDVSPYADQYTGAILNATINLYAYATIEPTDDGKIILQAADSDTRLEFASCHEIEINGNLDLLKGVYNRIVKEFSKKPLSFKLTTWVDAPAGSGLGTSSTLVVAILSAFAEWLRLPLGEYDLARLAFEIERVDLAIAGGRQDQYAATFGGFNFMEFYPDEKVIVNPLRIKRNVLEELQFNLLLYYSGKSRQSAEIIKAQVANVQSGNSISIEATHRLREQAIRMKECVLTGNLNEIGDIFNQSWLNKKKMASGITNSLVDSIYETAIASGATGGKISGAGGGGFMLFYCPGPARFKVMTNLEKLGGTFRRFQFTEDGVLGWRI